MASASLFFLHSIPFGFEKNSFLILLVLIMWVIYSVDHLDDGHKTRGNSGIDRYDFHFIHRKGIIGACILFGAIILWLIYANRTADFVKYGYYFVPIMCLYFILKFKKNLHGLIKMFIISIIASAVTVSLYFGKEVLTEILSMERILMLLLAMSNQLVLEHYEQNEGPEADIQNDKMLYLKTLSKVFIWLIIFSVISVFLNPISIQYIIPVLLVGLFQYSIPKFPRFFKNNGLYRFWADSSFIFLWPLLELILSIRSNF